MIHAKDMLSGALKGGSQPRVAHDSGEVIEVSRSVLSEKLLKVVRTRCDVPGIRGAGIASNFAVEQSLGGTVPHQRLSNPTALSHMSRI